MTPLNTLETGSEAGFSLDRLWVRGGFPDSYLAEYDEDSYAWRRNFIRTYLERDVPQFGPRIPSETLERLWIMLAHSQGQLLNASSLAKSLSISAPTVSSYIDLLSDLLLVRRLPPRHANTKKRLVKSPRVYVRDSGLVHALLGIGDYNQLSGHPVFGSSWEGFVIENLLSGSEFCGLCRIRSFSSDSGNRRHQFGRIGSGVGRIQLIGDVSSNTAPALAGRLVR